MHAMWGQCHSQHQDHFKACRLKPSQTLLSLLIWSYLCSLGSLWHQWLRHFNLTLKDFFTRVDCVAMCGELPTCECETCITIWDSLSKHIPCEGSGSGLTPPQKEWKKWIYSRHLHHSFGFIPFRSIFTASNWQFELKVCEALGTRLTFLKTGIV